MELPQKVTSTILKVVILLILTCYVEVYLAKHLVKLDNGKG